MNNIFTTSALFLFFLFSMAKGQTQSNAKVVPDTLVKPSKIQAGQSKTINSKKDSSFSVLDTNKSTTRPKGIYNASFKRPRPAPHLSGIKHGSGQRAADGKKHDSPPPSQNKPR